MKEHYLTEIAPVRAILYLSVPMMIGNLFQQGYNAIDSVIAGKYISEQALAAVGACYAVSCVFTGLATGGGIGTSVITAGYWGAREKTRFKEMSCLAILTFFALGIFLMFTGYGMTETLLVWLGTPKEILAMSIRYLHIYFLGLPFVFLYNEINALFNSMGKSGITLFLLIMSSLVNLVLDILFVAVWKWEIEGAAWATVISQAFAAVCSALFFGRELKQIRVKRGVPFFAAKDLRYLIRMSLPSMFQQSVMFLGMLLVQSAVNRFGAQALAGYSFAMRIEGVSLVPVMSLGNAMTPYVAQNRGAGETERIVKGCRIARRMMLAATVLIGAAVHFKAGWLAKGYLGSDYSLAAYETGVGYLRCVSLFFWLNGLRTLLDGILRGYRDLFVTTAANFLNLALRVGWMVPELYNLLREIPHKVLEAYRLRGKQAVKPDTDKFRPDGYFFYYTVRGVDLADCLRIIVTSQTIHIVIRSR